MWVLGFSRQRKHHICYGIQVICFYKPWEGGALPLGDTRIA